MRRLINQRPEILSRLLLAALPFFLAFLAYALASQARLAINPTDKLLPAWSTILDAINRMTFVPDLRSGDYLLLLDTMVSLQRLAIGVGLAMLAGFIIGVLQGLIPYVRATLANFTNVVSMIPALAILPILFITFGLGETAKVVLIFVGIVPFIIRDLAQRVEEIPHEQIIKAQTLGASTWQIIIRIVVPQMLPRLIDSVRLSLGPAWLYLIAAEAIAAESGLGYRIFLMRRYLSMDVILPYVAWITFLAFFLDFLLRGLRRVSFGWMYRGHM